MVWFGKEPWFGTVWRGMALRGRARHGAVRRGKDWCGGAWQGAVCFKIKIKGVITMAEEKAETAIIPSPQQSLVEAALKQPSSQSSKVTRLASFTPVNLTESIALAKLMARSDLVPKEYKNRPENVLIGMQYAAELGIPPLLGIQNISIINGRAAVWGDLFLALIQTSPSYEWHKEYFEGSGDQYGAVCIMKRKGQEPHMVKFTVADAKIAKLWGKRGYNGQDTPWITNPNRMLQMRSRGFCGRDKFSDALKGLIIAEEAMDLPIDTSDAKKARENATMDISASVAALAPSPEQNRGHLDTGLERKRDEQAQAPAKPEPVMCSDCGKIDGHEPTCKHAAKAEQDAKTSKPTTKGLYLILGVQNKTDRKGKPYLLLEVVSSTPDGDKNGKLYVWHKSMFEYLSGVSDKKLVCEVSEQKTGDKTYYNVEHILELDNVPFVDGKPAEQAEMPSEEPF